jgi:S-methylmethionine-dependent homocysteine/selenocysteine methylase
MAKYRTQLPQLKDSLFLTDGGIETCLIFHDGLDLPHFAAFDLLKNADGRIALQRYYDRFATIAKRRGLGFVLESPTWRANPDWGAKLDYSLDALAAANREAIALMERLRANHESRASPMVISGNIGPRGDGYDPGMIMTPDEAQDYHSWQVGVFAETEADMVAAATLTNVNEAVGIARAAKAAEMPVALSFTLETDGRLPTGQTLKEAVETVDLLTGSAPAYYMINCAHPTHFKDILAWSQPWLERLRGLRANASKRSHAELNEAPDLDAGDPVELGRHYGELRRRHRQFCVFGGCCGTDQRHVEQICEACLEAA